MTQYEAAKKRYAERGVDADAAIDTLKSVPVSLHCWQGDDVRGFVQRRRFSGGWEPSAMCCMQNLMG